MTCARWRIKSFQVGINSPLHHRRCYSISLRAQSYALAPSKKAVLLLGAVWEVSSEYMAQKGVIRPALANLLTQVYMDPGHRIRYGMLPKPLCPSPTNIAAHLSLSPAPLVPCSTLPSLHSISQTHHPVTPADSISSAGLPVGPLAVHISVQSWECLLRLLQGSHHWRNTRSASNTWPIGL